MKRIRKQLAPESFVHWVRQNRPQNWNSLDGGVKQELADQLRREQGGLCCYCEQRIAEKNSHIEHLRPRNTYPNDTFDYQNLLSSCLDKKCCGTAKGRWFSPDMVTPLDDDCEGRFLYLGNGKIIPADAHDSHARDTIDRLNLNCNKLKNMRMQTFDVYRYMKENVSREEFVEFVSNALQPNHNNEYAGFWTTIKYVAEKA